MGGPGFIDANGCGFLEFSCTRRQEECREEMATRVREQQPEEPVDTRDFDRTNTIVAACRSTPRHYRDDAGNRRTLRPEQWHDNVYTRYRERLPSEVQRRQEVRRNWDNFWGGIADGWTTFRNAIRPSPAQMESFHELSGQIMDPVDDFLNGIFGGPEEAPTRIVTSGMNTYAA